MTQTLSAYSVCLSDVCRMMFAFFNVALVFFTPALAHESRKDISYLFAKSKTIPAYPQQDIEKVNVMEVSLSDLDSYINAIRTRVNHLTKYGTKLNKDINTLERYISVWNATFPALMTKEGRKGYGDTCESADALKILGLLVTKFHQVEVDTKILNDSIITVSNNLKTYKSSMNRTVALFEAEIESSWKTLKELQSDQKSAEKRISALESNVRGLTTRVGDLESNMTHAHAAQKRADTRTKFITQKLDKVTQQVKLHRQNIDDIQNIQTSIIKNMSLMENNIKVYYDRKVSELNKKLLNLRTDQRTAWGQIKQVQRDLVPMKESIYYLQSTLSQFMTAARSNISKAMSLLRDADMEKYLGCYVDSKSRIMHDFSSHSKVMTKSICSSMCRRAGYYFYGLEAGHTCFCGYDFLKSEKRTDSECNAECYGDRTVSCGGTWRMAIYKIYYLDQM